CTSCSIGISYSGLNFFKKLFNLTFVLAENSCCQTIIALVGHGKRLVKLFNTEKWQEQFFSYQFMIFWKICHNCRCNKVSIFIGTLRDNRTATEYLSIFF